MIRPPVTASVPVQPPGVASERGVALLAVLGFLILMALIAGGLLLTVNSDRRLVVQSMGDGQALNLAEAGVAEAMERIRTGEIPSTPNPRMVGQIYLCAPGQVPASGADTIGLATWQSPGSWLLYSTTGKSSDALTVRFKTDAARRSIYRFDPTRTPTVQTQSGDPVFVVTSTGEEGESRRRIVTELTRARMRVHDLTIQAAVVSGGDVHLGDVVNVCGYNHREDTPTWIGLGPRIAAPKSCNEDLDAGMWEEGPTIEQRYGVWAAGGVEPGSNGPYGEPQPFAEHQSDFYAGCWQALNLTETEFTSMIGPPSRNRAPRVLRGLTHYQGNTTLSRCDGDGLLYVEGDLHLGKDFTYRGLVYATGRVYVEGSCWVLGAVIAGAGVNATSSDRAAVLYSRETIENAVSRYASRFVRLSWREG